MSSEDKYTIRKFVFDSSRKSPVEVKITELCRPEYGYYTWPCSVVLAQYIFFNQHEFAFKNVCELGCGTSLCGLLAAKFGSNVTLTDDFNTNKSLESLIKQSIESNNIENITIQNLIWGDFTKEIFEKLPKIDICLGSDVFFDSQIFESLIATIRFLININNPEMVFYTAFELRSIGFYAKLEYLLSEYEMVYKIINLNEFNGDRFNIAQSNMPGSHDMYLLKIENKIKNS